MPFHTLDYPRPQMVRDNWKNLNGDWEFSFDDEDVGIRDKWYENFPSARHICVPFASETELSGIHDEKLHRQVWYKRSFFITRNDEKVTNRMILHFEGSDYSTSLWINGIPAGTHNGGYERFSFDITAFVIDGENTITVRVTDSENIYQPRGKQRWRNESYECWYVQTTGIWKTVWMEEVNETYIEELKLTPAFQKQEIVIDGMITGILKQQIGNGNYSVELECSFEKKIVRRVNISLSDLSFHTVMNVFSANDDWTGVKAWSPSEPNLYDLTIRLINNEREIDKVTSYFGMREIRIENGNILLNGIPLYQKLILDQGYWKNSGLTPPNEQALIDDIDKIHEMGFNGLRKHQKIEDERFLYWCDVKGMLVWSEAPATYAFSDQAVCCFTEEWIKIVKQNYNHPCIITWTPFNESWGVPEIETSKAQQHFTEGIYYLTKALDPYRPVICNDGWEHTVSDVVTLHDYTEKGADFHKRYSENKDGIFSTEVYHCKTKSAMANGFAYHGQPVIISEYGGIAFTSGESKDWGYGNKVNNEEEFLERYRSITSAIKEIPWISGFCYTQLTDVQQEVNGLLNEERKEKVEPSKIKEINDEAVTGRFI
ncbi:MAG: glycoside hydrolase family 2 [Lachnospiraceae bacterium]|jgi:beta-galactosidase/beta-glucuronidase|nr:glycoside hydrolase family 2 [Lachnospiraceae bacterium]